MTKKKIESLTQEQIDQFPHFIKKWVTIGLSTEPANRPESEKWVVEAYKKANINPPKEILWADSPQAGHNLHCKIRGKNDWVIPFYAHHEAGWLSFYDVFHTFRMNSPNFPDCSRLFPLMELAKNCGWVWMFDQTAICTERPCKLNLNDRGKLHSTTGKAIVYPDGWGYYMFNGTMVPEKVIMAPETYTKQEILKLNNTEVIRALAENLGWDKYLKKLGTIVIDTFKDPNTQLNYELLESKHRHGEFEPRFLRKESSVLKDGTQPWYIEPVHPGLNSAQAARKFQAMAAYIDNDASDNEYITLMQHCNNEPELVYNWEF